MIKKILLFGLFAFSVNAQSNLMHHEISAEITPSESFLSVVDKVVIQV